MYTSRQLLQLFRRAYVDFSPEEDAWQREKEVFVDPFRPTIQPGGFSTLQELAVDREQHGLRFHFIAVAATVGRSGRRLILRLSAGYPLLADFVTVLERLRALQPAPG